MTTTPDDVRAWLGPAFDELDAGQLARFCRHVDTITDTYPDPDAQDERDAAMAVTVQWLLDETTLAEVGGELRRARYAVTLSTAAARQAAILAVEDGAPVQPTATNLGVDRMSVLKWLGRR